MEMQIKKASRVRKKARQKAREQLMDERRHGASGQTLATHIGIPLT